MAESGSSIATRHLIADHISPLLGYAALSRTDAARSSYLLESLSPHSADGHRYSIVAYRPQTEEFFPPGTDITGQFPDPLQPSEQPTGRDAARWHSARVGYLSFESIHPRLKIQPWAEEDNVGRLLTKPSVVSFDHHTHGLSIAGMSPNAVARCEWEVRNGKALFPMAAPDPSKFIEPAIEDGIETVKRRIKKALRLMADRGLASMPMAASYVSLAKDTQPLDVYRALRVLRGGTTGIFIQLAEMPVTAGVTLMACADSHSQLSLRDDSTYGADLVGAVVESLALGDNPAAIAKAIRDTDAGPRATPIVSVLHADGDVILIKPDVSILQIGNAYYVTATVTVTPDVTPESFIKLTLEAVKPELAAIQAAHDAVAARLEEDQRMEAARERKRAKEEAAAEAAAKNESS